tara:strand:+ start:1607 stop:2419 length:813 start_codon:yes stop_codon:yes gene_type:complete
MAKPPEENRYKRLVSHIFFDKDFGNFQPGDTKIAFERDDLNRAADVLGIKLPKNLGDVLYSFRHRTELPDDILATQHDDRVWIIEMAGRAAYEFRLVKESRILPNEQLMTTRIPDATPELIRMYALGDEQALLAILRYNRLIDTFLGITTYSLQNHLRSTTANGAQLEIDELYAGVDKRGGHYIIPVQAKGGTDQISVVQSAQDLKWCTERFPDLRARLICAQFMSEDRIAMFELVVEGDELKVADERHYQLVRREHLELRDHSTYFSYE